MADLSRLPHELVLLIIEEACRACVHSRAGWVASLCLVCKSIQSVVTPILYARLFMHEYHMVVLNALFLSGASNQLSLVREVFFDFDACFDEPDIVHNGIYAHCESIARALNGIRVISGPSYVVEALANANPRLHLQLAAVFITDSTAQWRSLAGSHSFGMLLLSLKYLHLVVDVEEVLISDLALLRGSADVVQFLLLDVLADTHSPLAAERLDNLIPALSPVAQTLSPNIKRLLLRPRCALEENSHRMTARFAAWAELNRDPRIFVDDVFVPIHDGKRYLHDELDEEDALEGEALWWRGRQLWQGDSH